VVAQGVERVSTDVGLDEDRGPTADEIEIEIERPFPGTAGDTGNSSRFRGYGVVLVALLGLLVAGAALITVSDGARRQAAISFFPVPEQYTELYFSERRPAEVVDGSAGEAVIVRFTIANHEGRSQGLRYTVRVVDGAEVPLGAVTDSVEIGDTVVTTIASTIPVPTAVPWSAVEVTLDGRPERLRLLRAEADAMAR
jgi:hypothetical protein